MKDPQKQRIKELEKELENERLKVIAFKKLIEIAEREDVTFPLKTEPLIKLVNGLMLCPKKLYQGLC